MFSGYNSTCICSPSEPQVMRVLSLLLNLDVPCQFAVLMKVCILPPAFWQPKKNHSEDLFLSIVFLQSNVHPWWCLVAIFTALFTGVFNFTWVCSCIDMKIGQLVLRNWTKYMTYPWGATMVRWIRVSLAHLLYKSTHINLKSFLAHLDKTLWKFDEKIQRVNYSVLLETELTLDSTWTL